MKTNLFLCGAGNAEGVRLAVRINQSNPRWENIFILDDDKTKHGNEILGVKIAGSFDCLSEVDAANSEVANLVARTTQKRLSALQKIKMFGIPFAPLIDPTVDTWGVQFEDDITVYQNVTFSAGAFVDSSSVVFTGAVNISPSGTLHSAVHFSAPKPSILKLIFVSPGPTIFTLSVFIINSSKTSISSLIFL